MFCREFKKKFRRDFFNSINSKVIFRSQARYPFFLIPVPYIFIIKISMTSNDASEVATIFHYLYQIINVGTNFMPFYVSLLTCYLVQCTTVFMHI